MANLRVTKEKRQFALYVKSFIFGVEDSLVSTVGMLSGIAAAGVSRGAIIVSGIVLIFVEAFSMGVGNLLSEHSAEEYLAQKNTRFAKSIIAGFIMFASYFVTGFIPLAPYVWLETATAMPLSIGLSLATLFLLGVVAARIFKIPIWRKALEMLFIGGGAVAIGVLVGGWVRQFGIM